MKSKVKRLSKSTVSILLSLIMVVSMLAVGIISVNAWAVMKDTKIYLLDVDGWGKASFHYWGNNWNNHKDATSYLSGTKILYLTNGDDQINDLSGYNFQKVNGDASKGESPTYSVNGNISGTFWSTTGDVTQHTDMTGVNSTSKVVSMVMKSGSTLYTKAADSACVAKISGKTFSSGSASDTNQSTGSTSDTATIYPAFGSTVNIEASSSSTYTFKGFSKTQSTSLPSDANTGKVSYESTNYNGTDNPTYYAYFAPAENKYDVTVKSGDNGKVKIDSGTETSSDQTINVGTVTTKKVTAVPNNDGYKFSKWTVDGNITDNGVSISNGNTTNPLEKVGATSAGTLTANFTKKETKTVTVNVGENGKVTVSGSSFSNQNQTFASAGTHTFDAREGDVISFSAEGDPTTSYKVDTLKYSTDGSNYNTVSGGSGSLTVGSSGTYIIDATFTEKGGSYAFYVSVGTGCKANVYSTDHYTTGWSENLTAGNRYKFVFEDGEKFAVVVNPTSTSSYNTPTVQRVDDSHPLSQPLTLATTYKSSYYQTADQTSSDADGATYYITTDKKMGTTASTYYFYYRTSASDSAGTMKAAGKMKYVSGNSGNVWIDISDFTANDDVFVITKETSWSQDATHNTHVSTLNSTDNSIDLEGSKARKDTNNNYYTYIKPKTTGTYRITFNPTTSTADVTKTSSSDAITSLDTYYLGGRFKVIDSDTGKAVFTGAEEDNWSTYSVKLPFTKASDKDYYQLATNLTLSELSSLTENKQRYFIVHDKTNIYANTTGDSKGLDFENYKTSSNALTLGKFTDDLSSPYELLFSDAENNSDGLVTIHFNPTDSKIWYTVDKETAPVASGVTLTPSAASTTAGSPVTLTAAVSGQHANASNLQYTFYDQDGNVLQGPSASNTCKVSYDYVRTLTYKVVVSADGTDSSTGKALRVVSAAADVQYTNPDLYITKTDLAGDATKLTVETNWDTTAINNSSDSYSFALSSLTAGQTYEFALATKAPVDDKSLADIFYIDDIAMKYCDVTVSSLTVKDTSGEDEESYTVVTYKVTPRTNCAKPKVYIDCAEQAVTSGGTTTYYPGRIYAVATYTPSTTKTKEEDEKVTYYFAEDADNTKTSDPDSTGTSKDVDGVSIRYWNNSLEAGDLKAETIKANATAVDVTTPAKFNVKTGAVDSANGSNQIYVDVYKFWQSGFGSETVKTFNVYKVELPIWATSFCFTDNKGTPISTRSIGSDWQEYAYGSLLLNPNRVYLLYKDDSDNKYTYTKAVVLDKGLWDSNVKNKVGTKTFKSNAVNFNTTYSNNAISNDFNKWLSTDTAYAGYTNDKALYFGYFGSDPGGLNDFTLANNLAMRNTTENDYFASIQDLVAEKIDTRNTNSNGFPLLQAYTDKAKTEKVNMPLFDYDALASNKQSSANNLIKNQYLGVDFPMYESTFNGITTYSYDSSTDLNRIISDGNFTVDTDYRVAADQLGYSPFGDDDKYGSATELDVEFFMSNTGSLKAKDGTTQDITFNFTGDDDVWVYVDGVLVLDLGGAHKASAGSINFTDMKVYYKTAARTSDVANDVSTDTWPHDTAYVNTVNMQALLEANGVNFNNKDAATKHTFQMFYMERGAIDSNMSVSYNLPQASGLNIKNEVTANNVNPGLVNAAMLAANSDYFSYGVESALNHDSLYDNVSSAYSNTNQPANSAITTSAEPKYPYNSDTKRSFTTTLNTSAKDNDRVTRDYVLSKSNSDANLAGTYTETTKFTPLSGVAYSLSDPYLAANTENENPDLEVTGLTDKGLAGEFHLLGGQSASFDDKVTPNSFVKVYQTQNLGAVDTKTAPIGFKSISDNNVGNYYITSYSIQDNHSSKWIKEKTELEPNHSGNIYAADNSNNDDSFYFSDYTVNETSTAAMTVTFYNDIAVGNIEISKKVDNDSNNSVPFYFDLKFANIFGSDDEDLTSLVSYKDLQYRVKNTETGAYEQGVKTYGETGIRIYPGQTAVISGVPVETYYQVTERSRSGFELTDINKTIVGPDDAALEALTPNHKYAEHFDAQMIKDRGIRSTSDKSQKIGDDVYYVNMIPRVQEAKVGDRFVFSTSKVAFTNSKASVKIKFHYYNREVKAGTPASISDKETVYTVSGALSDTLAGDGITNDDIKAALADMISGAAVEFVDRALTQNVVDDYDMWTSLADAKAGIATKTNVKDGKKYAESEYHTDYLSQPIPVSDESDANKWVSYKASGEYVNAEELTDGNKALEIDEVNVWLFNTPHEYNVTIYGAKSSAELSAETTVKLNGAETTVKVANANQSNHKLTDGKVYYNQRLGGKLGDSTDSTGYIAQYNQSGYRYNIEPVDYITRSTLDGGYRFAYWAFDPAGQIVASTNAYYYYRVTNDVTLYAVYAMADVTDPALSVYNNRNDVYVNTNGASRTRLNVILNPYDLVDSDGKMKQTALVYVNLSKTEATKDQIKELFNKYRNQLDDILTEKAANSFSDSRNYADLTIGQSSAISLTLTTKGYVRNTEDLNNGIATVKPTSKNRVQYTLDFATSSLKNDTSLMVLGAMYYSDSYNKSDNKWIISDNCLLYKNGSSVSLDVTE